MKCFVLLFALGAVLAEPQNYRTQMFGRVEAEAYPPSGWKPEGQKLELPPKATFDFRGGRVEVSPPRYGPPEMEATTEMEEATTVEPRTEDLQQGDYYVLLPGAKLQKFRYNYQSDPTSQQYSSVSTGVRQLDAPLVVYLQNQVQFPKQQDAKQQEPKQQDPNQQEPKKGEEEIETFDEPTEKPVDKQVEEVPVEDKTKNQPPVYVLLPQARSYQYQYQSSPTSQQYSSVIQSPNYQSVSAPLIYYTPYVQYV